MAWNLDALWIAVGFSGQLLFSGRFVVQWIVSEKRRASVVPTSFWYLSIAGGLTLLLYAVHKRDPVFIAGQAAGVFVYARNLMLLRNTRPTADAH